MSAVLLAVLALAGAALQRSVGAGYSLLLLPAALVALPDGEAVACVLAAGVVLTGGLLLRHGPPASFGGAGPALLAAPAGQGAAVFALGALDGTALRVTAAVVLAAGCALTALADDRPGTARDRASGAAGDAPRGADLAPGVADAPSAVRVVPASALLLGGAGLAIGAVGALTGVIGPFFALLLVAVARRGGAPAGAEELRRRLWVAVGGLSATGLLLGAAAGTMPAAGALTGVALAPALAVGVLAGAPLAGRLGGRAHARTVLGVAALGVVLLAAS